MLKKKKIKTEHFVSTQKNSQVEVVCLRLVFPPKPFQNIARHPDCGERALCLCSPRFNTTVICHEWQFVCLQQAMDLLLQFTQLSKMAARPHDERTNYSVVCDSDPSVAQTLVHSLWRWASCQILPFPLQSAASFALSHSHAHQDTCLIYSN